jgi:two-component SAPR family response regulator
MIVDDNESFVESLIFFIKQLGCGNIIFNKFYLCIEALEASTNICYDYIFMDVNLPDISGIDKLEIQKIIVK